MGSELLCNEKSQVSNFQPLFLSRRRILLLVGLGSLTIGLLLMLGGGRTAVAALADAYGPLVVLALLVHYSGFAVRSHRWQRLLAVMGYRLSYYSVTTLLVSGWFISALLPARAGDVARVTILYRGTADGSAPGSARVTSVPIAAGIGSIVLERALDILAILLLGAGFGFGVLRGQLPGWVLIGYEIGVGGLVIFGMGLLLVPTLIVRLRNLITHPLWQKILDFAQSLIESLRMLPQHPATMILVTLESLYIWLCDALLLWLVVWSLGSQLPFSATAFVALTVDVFAAVPLTPGGIGQVETVYAALLSLLALTGLNIPAVVLLTRAISYWSFLLLSGLVTFAAGIGQLLITPGDAG